MSKPMVRIHDLSTDEIIDREMNNEEFAQYEIDCANIASQQSQNEIAENLKASANAKLAALGLTEEEIVAFRG